ncbi:hypothetical protein [Nonomuraea cavernae]|uniref:hypothetical protein n=1 Tax=Nonomuraea cavernae TaxID=2045107 RepID=UPI0033DDA4DB
MTTTDLAQARERSTPPPDADSATGQPLAGLLRPHLRSFATVVLLQVIGAVAGLAPLLAVVELGRVLLSHGPIDHGHVWFVVIAGAAGLLVRLLLTAVSSGLGHVLDGRVQLAFRRRLAAHADHVDPGGAGGGAGSSDDDPEPAA